MEREDEIKILMKVIQKDLNAFFEARHVDLTNTIIEYGETLKKYREELEELQDGAGR